MPTEIVKYVDPDGGILADYTSLQAAITAEKAIRSDLVARDEVLKLMCISSAGSPDTTQVVINSGDFVTDATRNIVIEGDNNTGIWDNSKYLLQVPNALSLQSAGYLTLVNMQIDAGSTNAVLQSTPFYVLKYCTIINCFVKGTINVSRSNGYTYIINSIIVNISGSAINLFNSPNLIYNTILKANNGIINQYKPVLLKNVLIDATTPITISNGATSDGNYNLSTVFDSNLPGLNSINGSTVNFADASAGDFRLLAGSPGIDQGVDLSADPNYAFNTDIIGTARPQGSAWDIGAFELIQQTFNPAWAKHSNQIIRAL